MRNCGGRLAAGPAPQFASLVKGRWPRRQARAEGLPRHEMPPPEAAAHPVCLRRRGVRDDASIVPYTGSR